MKATSRAPKGCPSDQQDALAGRDAQDQVRLAPLVGHGEPGDVLGAHAVEDEERLVDAGQGRPAGRGGGGERVEVAHPRGLLLLRDDEHARGRRRAVARTGGQREHRERHREQDGRSETRPQHHDTGR